MTTADSRQGEGASVRLEDVAHTYGDSIALRGVTLTIAAGEFLTLLGPSGSGKTTTLSLISGFLTPTSGRILVGGEDVTRVPAHRRNLGMVFQNYALFPHLTVMSNVMFPLRVRHVGRREAAERALRALKLVQLEQFKDRYPRQLSGGQQQRVALARAIVYDPPVLLMDEPFGALDRQLRHEMQLSLRELHRSLRVTVIFVTHDQEEALTLSDRIALMHDGQIMQEGSPRDLYEQPRSEFAARFMGNSNMLTAQVVSVGSDSWRCLTAPGMEILAPAGSADPGSEAVSLLIRPERIRFIGNGEASSYENVVEGHVDDAIFLGDGSHYVVHLPGGGNLLVKDVNRGVKPSGPVRLGWHQEDVVVLPDFRGTPAHPSVSTRVES